MAICQCGCNQEIPIHPFHKYRKTPVKYIYRHFQNSQQFREVKAKSRTEPTAEQIHSGFCGCGCGGSTPIAEVTNLRDGHFRGQPTQYINGHHRIGKRSAGWKGGRKRASGGYWLVYRPDHHLANISGYVLEHRFIWEEANGRELQSGDVVHHINGDRGDNRPENLVAMTRTEHADEHRDNPFTTDKRKQMHERNAADPEYRRKQSENMKRVWADRKRSH